jgi:hypothetical protein
VASTAIVADDNKSKSMPTASSVTAAICANIWFSLCFPFPRPTRQRCPWPTVNEGLWARPAGGRGHCRLQVPRRHIIIVIVQPKGYVLGHKAKLQVTLTSTQRNQGRFSYALRINRRIYRTKSTRQGKVLP